MAEPRDPTGQGTVTVPATPGQESAARRSTSQDSGGSEGMISREAHEAALAEARKRQSGTDREASKRIAKLEAELADTKAVLSTLARSKPDPELPPLDPNDPATVHVAHLNQRFGEWTESLTREREQAAAQARLENAIADAVQQGVPMDDLDDTSPETVQASAKEYLREKRIRDLETELQAVKSGTERAVTQTREELGATAVNTATGDAPSYDTVDAQIAAVTREKIEAQRLGGVNNMVFINKANQALNLLNQWKAHPDSRGGRVPMPAGWQAR